MTKTCFAPCTRSIAPPTAGTPLEPTRQLARIAVLRHLIGAEDRDIEMAAAHHGEAIGMMEEGSARLQRHRFLAGIDQIPVFLARCGDSPKFRIPFSVWKIA